MADERDISTISGVRAYLADTPFASETITPLTGGFANFVFRLQLLKPYKTRSTLICKHAKPFVGSERNIPFGVERQEFEVEALNQVKAWLPEDSIVTVPAVHHFDKDSNVIIMDDCGESSLTLKQLILNNAISATLADKIGTAIGQFLGRLHNWGRGNDVILDFFNANEQVKRLAAWMTHGRLVSTLTGADDLPALSKSPVTISESQLAIITKLASETLLKIDSSRNFFIVGDFWPGNIMITLSDSDLKRIYILDWEAANPGLPGMDVGQFCAELHLLRRFHPRCSLAASTTLGSFLDSYSHIQKPDTGLSRDAIIQLGAHLVALTPRIPWGSEEQTRSVVEEGVELLVGGYTRGDDWLQSSLVGPLIAR